jgi:hypothetical protein
MSFCALLSPGLWRSADINALSGGDIGRQVLWNIGQWISTINGEDLVYGSISDLIHIQDDSRGSRFGGVTGILVY